MPSPRLAGFTASRSRPSSVIAPPLGSTKPAIICRVVVLPQPEGPSSDTNSPFSTPKVRPIDGDVAAEALGEIVQREERHR